VKLPKSLQVIKESAFDGCESLTAIELPLELSVIGDYAFQNCRSLKNINSSHVPDIRRNAFLGCDALNNQEY
jgi:predicted component of type VI protein secretion system